jgi:hypothetical protein
LRIEGKREREMVPVYLMHFCTAGFVSNMHKSL